MIDIGNWTICLDNSSPMTVAVLDKELDSSEIKAVDELLKDSKLTKFTNVDLSFSSCWINYNDNTAWLYGRIAKLFEYTNNGYQIPDLVMIEKIAYFEYDVNDYHALHADVDMGIPFSSRKLSMIINLSSSEDYRGGDIEFTTGHTPYNVSRSAGSAIIGPSYLLKQIKHVTSGKRRHLIAWINSPSVQL